MWCYTEPPRQNDLELSELWLFGPPFARFGLVFDSFVTKRNSKGAARQSAEFGKNWANSNPTFPKQNPQERHPKKASENMFVGSKNMFLTKQMQIVGVVLMLASRWAPGRLKTSPAGQPTPVVRLGRNKALSKITSEIYLWALSLVP